jgi:arginase family enzyme
MLLGAWPESRIWKIRFNKARSSLSRVNSTRAVRCHLDADVINPALMAAVDSPEPGGPTIKELADLLTPLVRHPRALGLELTIYDPGLDPDRSCAARLVSLLESVLLGVRSLNGRAA